MGVPCIEVNCAGDPTGLGITIFKAPNRSIILLDEIQSMPRNIVESTLYRYMDEGIINNRHSDGTIEPFKLPTSSTIIATTNEIDKVLPPLMNRFSALKLKPYTHEQMVKILKLYLNPLQLTDDAYNTLANVTRYIPRMAVKLSTDIANYALQYNLTSLDKSDVVRALSLWGIDEHGLTDDDRAYISLLFYTYNNRPTGIKQIAGMLEDSEENITSRESYLIKQGILMRTGKGRELRNNGLLIAMSLPDPNGDST